MTTPTLTDDPPDDSSITWSRVFILLVFGTALTVLFWWKLIVGGGIVGGDTYPYFFPQKTFYADALKSGSIPLWNNLTGFGYPLLAESQTGVFYPPNLLAYSCLDPNTAYNLIHVAHYVFAFVGTGLLCLQFGIGLPGAILAATVFVFGWFPARLCLEWAITTGSYLPWELFCVTRIIQLKEQRSFWGLSVLLCLHLFLGHFNLAFIAIITCLAWAFFADHQANWTLRSVHVFRVATSVTVGLLLAAIQLVPTAELKMNSQRSSVDGAYQFTYGVMPPWFISQTFLPFILYDPYVDTDALLAKPMPLNYPSATNRVEAFMYFGLAPLLLTLAFLFKFRGDTPPVSKQRRPHLSFWMTAACLAMIYATGWLSPVTRLLPGFSYFTGPGRYTIITSLAVAIICGWAVRLWIKPFTVPTRTAIYCCLVGLTVFDLYLIGRNLPWMAGDNVGFFDGNGYGYAVVTSNPPAANRQSSLSVQSHGITQFLNQETFPPRLLTPGPNLINSLGIASTPVYLGIGPQEYFDPDLTMPSLSDDQRIVDGRLCTTPAQLDWLQKSSITHVLSFEPLNFPSSAVGPTETFFDPFLSPAWARYEEPLYLTELHNVRPRLSWLDPLADNDKAATTITLASYNPNSIAIQTFTSRDNRLLLTDLDYPGWVATIDGNRVPITKIEGLFRAVDVPSGKHEVRFDYRPLSVLVGGTISALTLIAMLLAVVFQSPVNVSRLAPPSPDR